MTGTEPSATDALNDTIRASYDALPYENRARWNTHPDCLATAARLRGLEAPPVATARVLELGCSTGENLVALAVALPEGRFVGIDLSATQIERARVFAASLGLPQVRFEAADLRAVAADLGEFDYIVCHGVYSHVPADVQDAILAICARSLAPQGVACISHNTYPGWHLRGMVRDVVRRHVDAIPDVAERAARARELVGLLARHAQQAGSGYREVLAYEHRLLSGTADSYIAHEHLDPINAPVWIGDFVERAREKGLDFLGDALPEALPDDLPDGLGAVLATLADDPVAREQYHDCLTGRTFRRTLLTRAGAATGQRSTTQIVESLVVRCRALPVAEQPAVRSFSQESFRTADGYGADSNDPMIKAMLVALWQHTPSAMTFGELRGAIRDMLEGSWPAAYRRDDPAPLAEALARLHRGRLLSLHTLEIPFASVAGERPLASPLARAQAQRSGSATNLRHETVDLDLAGRSLLPWLDGTRDRNALLACNADLDAASLDDKLTRLARCSLLKA